MKHLCNNGMTVETVEDRTQDLVRVSFSSGLRGYMSLADMAEAVEVLHTPDPHGSPVKVRLHSRPLNAPVGVVTWRVSAAEAQRQGNVVRRNRWVHVPIEQMRKVVADYDAAVAADRERVRHTNWQTAMAERARGFWPLVHDARPHPSCARAFETGVHTYSIPVWRKTCPHPYDLEHVRRYTSRESYPDAKKRLQRELNAELDAIRDRVYPGGYTVNEAVTRASLATMAFAERLHNARVVEGLGT